MALVFYCRVSTQDQNLARQYDRAKQVGAEKIFADKISGKNLDRPALKEMMEYLREGDTLQVVSLDRLSRDYNDLKDLVQRLRKMKVKLIVDDLPQSNTDNELVDQFLMDMMIQLMGFVAQNEREKIKERQAQGIRIAKQKGLYKGRTKKISSTTYNGRIVKQTTFARRKTIKPSESPMSSFTY